MNRKPENADPETFTVLRDDGRDLRFSGTLLGQGQSGPMTGPWLTVSVYRTQAGAFVVSLVSSSIFEGEAATHRADVFDNAGGVFEWLLAVGQGTLGPASREALKSAASVDPELFEASTEQVD